MTTKATVAARIATLVTAIENCRKSGNHEWEHKHGEALRAIVREHMPSGSGIDCGTLLDDDATSAECLAFIVQYHHMNDAGMYDGWTSHVIRARPSFLHGVALTISGPDRNGMKDYLHDVYQAALLAEVQS